MIAAIAVLVLLLVGVVTIYLYSATPPSEAPASEARRKAAEAQAPDALSPSPKDASFPQDLVDRYFPEPTRDGGQVLAKPGSITPHTTFEAEAYILTKEEGGRHTPFFTNYRPQFYFRTSDVTGVVTLPEGTKMVMPGDKVRMVVDLIQPIAMDEGLRFAIRDGGRTFGVVTKIAK
jgi:hypothetical protein